MDPRLYSILLVDDDPADNFYHKIILEESEYVGSIQSVLNGQEAFSYLNNLIQAEQILPDLIFLDINMPKMNGFDFLDEFQTLPASILDNCKIVMLSSSIHPADVEKAQKYPECIKYMNKPLSRASLGNLADFIQQL